jgi:hypothetical protein
MEDRAVEAVVPIILFLRQPFIVTIQQDTSWGPQQLTAALTQPARCRRARMPRIPHIPAMLRGPVS